MLQEVARQITAPSMAERWRAFLEQYRPHFGHRGATCPGGRLQIMGAGIGSLDLLQDAGQAIESADYVMYCLADPVTQAYVEKLRPDALAAPIH